MTGAPLRASRVRKCRFQHQCPVCHGQVLIGQSESLVTGAGWAHVDRCIIQAQRQVGG